MSALIDIPQQWPQAAIQHITALRTGHHAEQGTVIDDDRLATMLAALGHPVRLNLWRALLPHENTGLSAGTLASCMAIIPSSLSFHLKLMRDAGLLVQRRSSRHIIYAVNGNVGTVMARSLLAMAQHAAASSEQANYVTGNGASQPEVTICDVNRAAIG